MWVVTENSYQLQMTEGDYGIQLPVIVEGTELTENDSLKITFKTHKNGELIFDKEYTNIENNKIQLELTQEESEKFPVGNYVYSIDWFQNNMFMCCLINQAGFKVVEKI